MKVFETSKLRNVALVSHGGAGKTSLAEAMLYAAGATDRRGKVDDGNSVLDYDPDEVKRGMTLNTALAPCQWQDCKINILDTPGYADFVGDVKASLRVADAALVVVCAASGVEVQTEKVWQYADDYQLPRLVFINKMDRENADFDRTLQQIQEELPGRTVALQMPMGQEADFRGTVDLLEMKALVFAPEAPEQAEEQDIPEDFQEQAAQMRDELVEAVAETDDELTLKYLEGESLSQEEIIQGLRQGVKNSTIIPVFCGAAYMGIGLPPLMEAMVNLMPEPAERAPETARMVADDEEVVLEADPQGPLAALVFKTTADPYVGRLSYIRVFSGSISSDSQVYNANRDKMERVGQLFLPRGKEQLPVEYLTAGDIGAVAKLQETTTNDTLASRDRALLLSPIVFPQANYPVAISACTKGDEDKLGSGLGRITEEDPTLSYSKHEETAELILSGLGDVHLDVTVERLKRKFGVEVQMHTPRVPFRETVRKHVQVEGKYKKQTGGHGQYGHVWLELEPLPEGTGFEFAEKIVGGVVPRQYIPAVEKGVRETMQEGVFTGYPVVDVKVTLYDGSYHSVDSSEMAFKVAASQAFKKGMEQAEPVLLEPIMLLEVVVPEAYMGDVIGDVNAKRGRILGMEREGGNQVIRSHVPLAELSRYAIDLKSLTQGRGSFSMSFDHYEEAPARVMEMVKSQADQEKNQQ